MERAEQNKDIIKIRAEINKIENKQKPNKMDKSLGRLTKKQK